MKPIDHYLSLKYPTSVYQDEEGDYIVEVDDLPGCLADGRTPDEAFANLQEAKRSWMESRQAAGLQIPEPRQRDEYSGRVLVRMPKFLHRKLFEQAKAEGTSLNQYIVALLSWASAAPQGAASNVSWAIAATYVPFEAAASECPWRCLPMNRIELLGQPETGQWNYRVIQGSGYPSGFAFRETERSANALPRQRQLQEPQRA